jgi:glycerophosphoryl diester phosphodiesterase
MKTLFRLSLLLICTPLLLGQTPSAAAAKLFIVDAKTPQGLRELFKPTPDVLPLLSAHRGGAGRGLPENCLATFEATVRRGWSMLEIDLHTTKDGVIVLMHDSTLDRTSNGKGAIADRTLAELQPLRLKDRDGNLTEHSIPTLEQAMKWARGKTLLVLDKKDVPVKDVVRAITENHAESYALMMAYSIQDVTECHALNPNVMMEAMLGTPARYAEFEKSGVPWSSIVAFVGQTATPDSEHIRRIRANGASCMASTVRNIDRQFLSSRASIEPLRPEYRAVLARRVDIIETDVPRDLAPLLHPNASTAGAKARFFRRE